MLRRYAFVGVCALLTLIPLTVLYAQFLTPQPEIWAHLREWVLPRVISNTLWLLGGVLIGVLITAVPLAWLTTLYRFPGQKFFRWALMLPLAIPAYVLAFVHVGLWDYTGPIQTTLRTLISADLQLPSVRSRAGLIIVMTLAFYPYVYLLARQAFLSQGRRALEAAQSLGLSPARGFFRVALPMAWPQIAAGCALVLMETLADFGAVSVFNYDTFTTAIYQSWFALFSLPSAAQLAAMLATVVFLLLSAEQLWRARRRYDSGARVAAQNTQRSLHGIRAWLATLSCALVCIAAFALPAAQLVIWASRTLAANTDLRLWTFAANSLLLSAMTALLAVALALLLAYNQRRHTDRLTLALTRLANLGYAIPGAVLAVALFIPLAAFDNLLQQWLGSIGVDGAVIKGTVVVMLLACVLRFLTVAYEPLHAGLIRITRSQDEVAATLGCTAPDLLRRVHMPQLRAALLSAMLMVFVDVMKEMPITLMTRPFGWDTLAVRIFELTSEGQWQEAAVPALAIVLVGMLPVWWLVHQSERATQ